MITRQDAINTGKAVIAGMVKELDNCAPFMNDDIRWMVRGMSIRMLDNIYFDVIPVKTRHTFHNRDDFYKQIGWPE